MTKARKTGGYKVTPAALDIPLVPVLSDDEQLGPGALRRDDLRVSRFESDSTTLEGVEELDRRKIEQCKRLHGSEQMFAIQRLVDEHPLYAADKWIQEKYYKFLRSGRQLRRQGRPLTSHSINPLIILAMIEFLVRTKRAKSLDDAFRKLAADKVVVSSEVAENRYRQAKNEPRFRAKMILFPELAKLMTDQVNF